MTGRTIVIGDVHGCARELSDLWQACDVGDEDRVVLVGDLVAKGPDSAGVIAFARQRGVRAVLGNHDAAVLRCHAEGSGEHAPQAAAGVRESEHAELARELSADDIAWLAALPLWIELPEHDAIVVHAGLVPETPLSQQTRDTLLRVRTIRPDGSPSSGPDDGPLWGELYRGPSLVLFGHHAAIGLQRHPYAIGLDTGCVYGGNLSACVLPERRIVSVAAREVYRGMRIDAGLCSSLAAGQARPVLLSPGAPKSPPREAIVVRDHEGTVHAYLNRCRHIPVPLDAGSRDFLARDGGALECKTHGARYRLHDGFCVAGPCSGRSLQRVRVQVEGDRIYLIV